jgi:transketolase
LIAGETDLSFTEDVKLRYQSYGWHVQEVADGNNDLEGIKRAIEEAKKVTDKPSIIKVRTTIGTRPFPPRRASGVTLVCGAASLNSRARWAWLGRRTGFGSKKEGTEGVHGSPLGEEDLANVKTKLGLDPAQKFQVPEEVRKFYSQFAAKGEELQKQWEELFEAYAQKHPELAAEFRRRMSGDLPDVLPPTPASSSSHHPPLHTLYLTSFPLSWPPSTGLGGRSSPEQARRRRGGHQEVLRYVPCGWGKWGGHWLTSTRLPLSLCVWWQACA